MIDRIKEIEADLKKSKEATVKVYERERSLENERDMLRLQYFKDSKLLDGITATFESEIPKRFSKKHAFFFRLDVSYELNTSIGKMLKGWDNDSWDILYDVKLIVDDGIWTIMMPLSKIDVIEKVFGIVFDYSEMDSYIADLEKSLKKFKTFRKRLLRG